MSNLETCVLSALIFFLNLSKSVNTYLFCYMQFTHAVAQPYNPLLTHRAIQQTEHNVFLPIIETSFLKNPIYESLNVLWYAQSSMQNMHDQPKLTMDINNDIQSTEEHCLDADHTLTSFSFRIHAFCF